ncbi:hypothetical protein KGO04_03955 [Patescibacteria group bacterium]|nr:hypothetical protein [Patescibacteria group bacterium]
MSAHELIDSRTIDRITLSVVSSRGTQYSSADCSLIVGTRQTEGGSEQLKLEDMSLDDPFLDPFRGFLAAHPTAKLPECAEERMHAIEAMAAQAPGFTA